MSAGTVATMYQYAALLRGIAPSGTNMTNDKLRGVFQGLGFANVASVLASGNIVFGSTDTDVPSLEHRIEDALANELGIASRTIIRAHSELRALVDSEPFPGLTHGRDTYLTVTFLKVAPADPEVFPEQPDPSTPAVRYDKAARAVLAITDNTVPGTTPDLMSLLERSYGKGITTRSWLTVQRVVKKLES